MFFDQRHDWAVEDIEASTPAKLTVPGSNALRCKKRVLRPIPQARRFLLLGPIDARFNLRRVWAG